MSYEYKHKTKNILLILICSSCFNIKYLLVIYQNKPVMPLQIFLTLFYYIKNNIIEGFFWM